MAFGDKLKSLRESKKMTQRELAEKLGVTSRLISYYEKGSTFPNDPELLHKLALLFNVTLDYLLLSSTHEEDRINKLIAKLTVDTREANICWTLFPLITLKEFENIYSVPSVDDLPLFLFPQFDDYSLAEEESYFVYVGCSHNGYLLAYLNGKKRDRIIALFAYINKEYKYVTDSSKISGIQDLYDLASHTDGVLTRFIDDYING